MADSEAENARRSGAAQMDVEMIHYFKTGASTRSVPRKLHEKTWIAEIDRNSINFGGQPCRLVKVSFKIRAN
nr:hypothetical protein [Mesorhizobium sp. LNHC220B00]